MALEAFRPMSATQRLNWLWRLAMTGLCFVVFGLGGLLLSVVLFNMLLLHRNASRRRAIARGLISRTFRFFLWASQRLGVLDYRVHGREKLLTDRGCLVVSNHPTLIDYVLLASIIPDLDCLVKAEAPRNPFFGGVIRAAGYLVNDRAEIFLHDCSERLAAGGQILIFPEGTRTRPGSPMVLHRGAANVAIRCRCDLRIVTIHCSEDILGKHNRWHEVPPRKPVFTVDVHDRLGPDLFLSEDHPVPSVAARRLNHALSELLAPKNP